MAEDFGITHQDNFSQKHRGEWLGTTVSWPCLYPKVLMLVDKTPSYWVIGVKDAQYLSWICFISSPCHSFLTLLLLVPLLPTLLPPLSPPLSSPLPSLALPSYSLPSSLLSHGWGGCSGAPATTATPPPGAERSCSDNSESHGGVAAWNPCDFAGSVLCTLVHC